MRDRPLTNFSEACSKFAKQFQADSYERQVDLEYAIDNKFLLSLGNFSASTPNSQLSLSAEYFITAPGDGPVVEDVSILGLLLAGCTVGVVSGWV